MSNCINSEQAALMNKEPIISVITQIELLEFSVVPLQIESFIRFTSIIGNEV